MTLLDRIKSLLGLGSTRSESKDRDVDVDVGDAPPDRSIDDESTAAETDDESTATETDDGSTATETEDPKDWGVPPGYDGDDADVQAGPEAFADEQQAGVETDTASADALDGGSAAVGIEDAEADASSETASTDEGSAGENWPETEGGTDGPIEEAEPDGVDADDAVSGEADLESASDGPELTEIKGIGPAYEQRLVDAGVPSVEALVEADTASLAESTDLSETRVGRWQDRAEALGE